MKVFLSLLAAVVLMGAAAQAQPTPVPVIFVHGNGDDATKWVPVIWLFESNDYPANRLFAIRLTDPAARLDDTRPEPFRSSSTDQASELSAFVTRVLLETKASKVALIGSSRGGLTIRNYVRNAGGAAVVSHAILCGTPNHGVMAIDTNLNSEFNGKGYFVKQLNEGSEVVEGVRFMTIRSDKLDKFAQSNVGYDGPALKGAENIEIANLDHREVAFHPLAFQQMYHFLTGQAPKQLKPLAQATVSIGGVITGFEGMAPTNRPLAGVHFRVFTLQSESAERDGGPVLDIQTTKNGTWGPLSIKPDRQYEFVLEKDGRTVSYFMDAIPRSTSLLNFRFVPKAFGQLTNGQNLLVHRPQGYLSKGRDLITVDGAAVEDLLPGVPTRDSAGLQIPNSKKNGVRVVLRDEAIHARPATADTELNIVELIWE